MVWHQHVHSCGPSSGPSGQTSDYTVCIEIFAAQCGSNDVVLIRSYDLATSDKYHTGTGLDFVYGEEPANGKVKLTLVLRWSSRKGSASRINDLAASIE